VSTSLPAPIGFRTSCAQAVDNKNTLEGAFSIDLIEAVTDKCSRKFAAHQPANDRFVEIVRAPRRGTFRAGGQPVRRGGRPPLPIAGGSVAGFPAKVATKGVIAPGFASSESGSGATVRWELAPPPRFLAVSGTSAWGRPQPFARQVGTRPRSTGSKLGKAIRSRAGQVGDRRCSASIRVGLWRHRAQADSELSGRCGGRLRAPAGRLQKSCSVPCRSQPRKPRRGSEERRNGELRARNGRSPGVPVFCEMVAEVGKRRLAQEAVLGRG
jgi:hypothetical protein